jgi:protein SCO1/2
VFLARKNLLPLLAVMVAVVVAATSAFIGSRPDKEAYIKPPEDIEDYLFWQATELTYFKLIGAGNKTLGPSDLKGKWSFIFFGYTHCPDVCPLTMGILGQAFKYIEKYPEVYGEIQGVFISVDPRRDTPELVEEYASYFSDKFRGVTGENAQLEAFSRQMSALYTIHPKDEPSGDNYSVTHNSTVFLVDPQGRLYGRFPPPQLPKEIAGTFIKIRTFYNEKAKQ